MVLDDRIVVVEEPAEGGYLARMLGKFIFTVTEDVEALHQKGREVGQFCLYAWDACSNSGRCTHSLPSKTR